MIRRPLVLVIVAFLAAPRIGLAQPAPAPWLAGFAKLDVTPNEPVRMAGYGNRATPSEGVDSPLSVRCLAFGTPGPDGRLAPGEANVLVSIDTIGIPGKIGREIAHEVAAKYGVPRHRLVLASTHTHTGPDLVSELSNIFAEPLSQAEQESGVRYRQRLVESIIDSVGTALADAKPAKISHGNGQVALAANRRVLKDGRWTGFGVQSDGPVDHSLPILRITSPEGKLRGVVFNYACHATTLTGNHMRINGDWPGLAALGLEEKHPGIVALSTIGCGADANPAPRGTLEDAVKNGQTVAAEISRLLQSDLRELTASVDAKADNAALNFELPTIEEVRDRIENGKTPQIRRLAKRLDEVYREEGRLPASYPVPIQSWRFGDQLTMIFLGGEVVVDYALRLKKELQNDSLWVTAYAGDVLGYIASERMRKEGGYEFDSSTVYYGLPGPWASGSEDLLIGQILAMLRGDKPQSPVSASEAVKTMRLSSDQYRIELVAAEPLVQDPINLAFGQDGKLWVVEMGDYPRGERGGRVKFLEDTDRDGRYDRATVFMDGLEFPTGVTPWRDGVLVTVAPNVVFAKDENGDGKADTVETLYTGFKLANPQHRVSGFSYGLDHSLHLAAGDNQGEITSVKTGQVINASGHDLQIMPDSHGIAITSGRTQYIRSRDDWGRWFGSDNSRPMYQYPIDAAYIRRNATSQRADDAQQLFDPPVAPPVFPATSAAVRFNDLYAANRFTSACSSIVSRSPDFDADGLKALFVCEPVHNLVHRGVLVPTGASFRAGRAKVESDREFLASTDPWFRPVRAEIGPDGALWVVDMYRETIEHPQWIPQAWQAQLDLYAGSDRGRIYRILPRESEAPLPGRIDDRSPEGLVELLRSPVGPLRDAAARLLTERAVDSGKLDEASPWFQNLLALAKQSDSPQARVQALSLLDVLGKLRTETIVAALKDRHPGVLIVATKLAEKRLSGGSQSEADEILTALAALTAHADPQVIIGLALALGESKSPAAGEALAKIAGRDDLDEWVQAAIVSSATPHAKTVLASLLQRLRSAPDQAADGSLKLVSDLLETSIAGGQDVLTNLRQIIADSSDDKTSIDVRMSLAASIASSLDRLGDQAAQARELIEPIYLESAMIAADPKQPEGRRVKALELFGLKLGQPEQEREILVNLLAPNVPFPLQRRAVALLSNIDRNEFVPFVVARWQSMTASLRGDCVSRILSRQDWIDQWLGVLEKGSVGVNELSAAARQQLLHSGSRSMMVRAQRLIESGGSSMAKQELVQKYLGALAAQGDGSHDGAALYKQHCGVCHTPDDRGRTIGPSLTNLSDRRDRALVEAILNPNLAVDPKYQSYQLRTEDDELVVGAIESEVGEAIALAKADGTRIVVPRSNVAEIKNSGVSLMPEGFENLLSPAQLAAIVRYLQQPAQ